MKPLNKYYRMELKASLLKKIATTFKIAIVTAKQSKQ